MAHLECRHLEFGLTVFFGGSIFYHWHGLELLHGVIIKSRLTEIQSPAALRFLKQSTPYCPRQGPTVLTAPPAGPLWSQALRTRCELREGRTWKRSNLEVAQRPREEGRSGVLEPLLRAGLLRVLLLLVLTGNCLQFDRRRQGAPQGGRLAQATERGLMGHSMDPRLFRLGTAAQ